MLSRTRFARLASNEDGNVLLIFAATLPLIVGAAGVAVDTVQMSLTRTRLQRAADSAAVAGAYARLQMPSANAAVTRDVANSSDVTLSGAPVVENPPTTGAQTGNTRAVRVVLATDQTLSFASFFVSGAQRMTAEATAMAVTTGEFCMLALDGGTETAVTMGGNTTVNIGCGIASNARSNIAISAGGSAQITATPITAVGGVPPSSAYAPGTERIPFSAPQLDPFAALPVPAPSNCSPGVNVNSNQTRAFAPGADGTACFNSIDIGGTATFAPGIYYINGGSLDFGSQARVTGTNVTFILTSTNAATDPTSVATMRVNGGAEMNLTSPASGTYKGVLFYEDPRASIGRSIRYNGNSGSTVEGAFYFPRAYLDFNGTSGMQTRCMQLVARRLGFSGNSRIDNVCPETGGGAAFRGTVVRLVS